MLLKGGYRFDPSLGFTKQNVAWENDRIVSFSESGGEYDVSNCYIIPGLTDIHFHGAKGADFSDGDPKGLEAITTYELSCGVTQICPTGMTLTPEQLSIICKNAAQHNRSGKPGAAVVGINLEGPFLSYNKKGAQNGAWLQDPNITLLHQLQAESEGLVKLVSIAPELPEAMNFIREASKTINVSIGHTEANYQQSVDAIEAGVRNITHLFNAMPGFAHRDPGVIGAAADDERVTAEIISDGVHIHPSAIRGAFKLFGKNRMILISDTMRAAGMPDGQYTLGGQDVIVKGNKATLVDGTLAGSVTDLLTCMQNAISFGIDPATAVTAAAVNPAKAIGVYDEYGSLDTGKKANILVLNPDFSLKAVIFNGEIVQGQL